MKNLKRVLAVFFTFLIVLAVSSCGSDDSVGQGSESENTEPSVTTGEIKENTNNRKLIYSADIDVETENYDEYVIALKKKINDLGGYYSSFRETGTEYRYLNIQIKIPSDKYPEMTTAVSKDVVVTYNDQKVEDVTLQYIDLQSRIEALQLQKEALNQMLENTSDVDTMLRIQESLKNVIAELESYQKKILALENSISYSTIDLSVREVNRNVEPIKEGPFKRIGNNFVKSIISIWNGIVELFVFFVGYSPFFILIGGLITVVVLIIVKTNKKNK